MSARSWLNLPGSKQPSGRTAESEGAEAVVPDLLDFMLYCFYNQIYKAEHLGTKKSTAKIAKMGIWAVENPRCGKPMRSKEQKLHAAIFYL